MSEIRGTTPTCVIVDEEWERSIASGMIKAMDGYRMLSQAIALAYGDALKKAVRQIADDCVMRTVDSVSQHRPAPWDMSTKARRAPYLRPVVDSQASPLIHALVGRVLKP